MVVHGHFSPHKYLSEFPSAKYLTFFREPTQYLHSLYQFWNKEPLQIDYPLNPLRKELLEHNLDFPGFILAYSRYSNATMAAYHPELFFWIGLTAYYQESLELLKRKLPELKIDGYKVKRQNPNRKIDEKYSEETAPLVRKLLPIYYERYATAQQKFFSECEKAGILLS